MNKIQWNEELLDEMLSEPGDGAVSALSALEGDIMVLGAGGKVGPTLSVMLEKASGRCGKPRNIYAVSRFTDPYAKALLEKQNVRCISCDLTDEKQLSALPKAPNIIFMAGRKFGTAQNAAETWKMNVDVPGMVTRYFGNARYTVFSTGNVYPFTSRSTEGWRETAGCTEEVMPEPVGEYGMTCLGRERMFEYAAKHYGARVLIFRLNYAVDLRYGVLYDLAKPIMEGKPVSLNVPAFNCVWQRYVNECAIRSLTLASEDVTYLNITGRETLTVRETAEKLAMALGKPVSFTGEEKDTALLSCAEQCFQLFGYPDKTADELISMQAQWILSGGRQLDKPTHFEENKGKF